MAVGTHVAIVPAVLAVGITATLLPPGAHGRPGPVVCRAMGQG